MDKTKLKGQIVQLLITLLMVELFHERRKRRFEGMSKEDIEEMSSQELELYENNRKKGIAWYVTTELTKRIDDAPVLSDYQSLHFTTKRRSLSFS